MSFQRMSDPTPLTQSVRMARRLTLKTGGWYLALREMADLGPFPTARVAMNASRDLNTRLSGVDATSALKIIQSFGADWMLPP
jgi:hypothetical protein